MNKANMFLIEVPNELRCYPLDLHVHCTCCDTRVAVTPDTTVEDAQTALCGDCMVAQAERWHEESAIKIGALSTE